MTMSKAPPSLVTLPSEIRRLIVSHLVPDPYNLRRGCKEHLKNANLAHRCLHEWVTEFMFRDMALLHVLVGMSSHLELFGITAGNEHLLRHVKHISVQVPPALRWEIGSDNPFGHHLEEITAQRLCSKFRLNNPREMTEEQREYSNSYYHAMVEPFTDNRSWYRLLRAADASFSRVFKLFTNLEEISVACCDIVDQPSPTYSHTFVRQHGETVIEEPNPPFVKDDTVNVAWASSIVVGTAPSSVRTLRLSLANMDNFNSFATVNRLLSLSYRHTPNRSILRATKICLALRGIRGTHGSEDYHGDTGSAGAVRHWKKVLGDAHDLQQLELRDQLVGENIKFSHLEMTDEHGSVLNWILPGLALHKLRTLSLHGFLLEKKNILNTLSGHWPRLEKLLLEDIQLQVTGEDSNGALVQSHVDHCQGLSWLEIGRAMVEKTPGLRIKLRRPVSKIEDRFQFRLHPRYVEQLKELPGLDLEAQGPYGPLVMTPSDGINDLPSVSSLPEVLTTLI